MQAPEQTDFSIIKEIFSERDRGAAVIAAGFLDSKLTEAIKACLRSDKDTAKQLFRGLVRSEHSATRRILGTCCDFIARKRGTILLQSAKFATGSLTLRIRSTSGLATYWNGVRNLHLFSAFGVAFQVSHFLRVP
jgi:hypothetical protein